MIPLLSVIVAAYTLTRFFEILSSDNSKMFIKVLAGISILVTIFCIIGILGSGSPSRF